MIRAFLAGVAGVVLLAAGLVIDGETSRPRCVESHPATLAVTLDDGQTAQLHYRACDRTATP